MKRIVFLIGVMLLIQQAFASMIFIPMDPKQKDHLKAYGVAYWTLTKGVKVDWMLNYRGGSFAFPYFPEGEKVTL